MNKKVRKKFLADQVLSRNDSCELCGSKCGLEVHHIIPVVCERNGIDLDVEENMIVLCRKCHAILTPRTLLVKYGKEKKKEKQSNINRFYEECENLNDPMEVFDLVDKIYGFG